MPSKGGTPLRCAGSGNETLTERSREEDDPGSMTTRVSWKESLGMMAFGMPFFLSGAGLLLAALDVIPFDKSRLNGPQWILGAAGLVFGLPGWFYVSAGFKSLVKGGVLDTPGPAAVGAAVSAVLACMAVAVLGVAFFGKAEGFSGGVRIVGARVTSRGGDVTMQRVVFALLGLMTAVISGALGSVSVAALRAQRAKGRGRRTTG
jgi:hypothetical protein